MLKRTLWWTETSNKKHLFEIENFGNIINVFIVTYDQFDIFLMNKTINLY